MKQILYIFLIVFCSCSPVKRTAYELKIKGKTTIATFTDKSLSDKSIIQGFVYSRLDSTFLQYANITIDKELKIGVVSDINGFFKSEIKPGLYEIECDFIGHVPVKSKEIRVKKGQIIIIIFELGTDLNID